jgi:hypothetical protein
MTKESNLNQEVSRKSCTQRVCDARFVAPLGEWVPLKHINKAQQGVGVVKIRIRYK